MLLCLPFSDGALKGHFGKVHLEWPPLSTVVKLLCLQHVTEIECVNILECEVSFSVKWNDDSCFYTIISIIISFHGIMQKVLSYIKYKSFILHVQVMYWCMVYPSAVNLGKYPLIHPHKCGMYFIIYDS